MYVVEKCINKLLKNKNEDCLELQRGQEIGRYRKQ